MRPVGFSESALDKFGVTNLHLTNSEAGRNSALYNSFPCGLTSEWNADSVRRSEPPAVAGGLIRGHQAYGESHIDLEARTATCCHVAVHSQDPKALILMPVPRPVLLPAARPSSPRSS